MAHTNVKIIEELKSLLDTATEVPQIRGLLPRTTNFLNQLTKIRDAKFKEKNAYTSRINDTPIIVASQLIIYF